MNPLQVDILEALDEAARAEARRFMSGCVSQSIHQSLDWPLLNPPTARQTYLYFLVRDQERLVSAGVLRLTAVVAGLKVAAIHRGPVTATLEELPAVLQVLSQALRGRGVVSLTVNPHWTGQQGAEIPDVLAPLGFAPVPEGLQNFPTATALIDCTQTTDDMMAAMTQTGRRHLRKSAKAGVTCRPMATRAEAELANQIMAAMSVETGLTLDSQHDFTAHYDFLSAYPDRGSILVTEVEGKVFGAAVNYMEGARGFNMLLTTSSQVTVPRAYQLMWDSILSAKSTGATSFDMVGFPDEDRESDAGMKTRGAFKRGFGPQIVKLPPLMTKPLRPVLHHIIAQARILRRMRNRVKGRT
ncbi:lipid II:glycine glycyltransferase FemX [Pseudooctadecabacter jejudonensis]|uniref:FemAB family protein n=1 Tax=Pseudooctadecabacter jejudonensis TaxID=1391910 RepID=A0A1Y5SRC0_9RHOB|nr:peptidoglycan bridge formation glycyltransferase FemA/FemB family protein [Pseudooctadecabacter jejudonensis]SLN45989.1 FemAB family protein [Pseudooctadecabacter jejudonensis]